MNRPANWLEDSSKDLEESVQNFGVSRVNFRSIYDFQLCAMPSQSLRLEEVATMGYAWICEMYEFNGLF